MATQKSPKTTQKDLSATQKAVLDYFRDYPKGTRADAANAIPDLSEDGVKYLIGRLQRIVSSLHQFGKELSSMALS